MSDTKKSKKVPNNVIDYIVCGTENELEINATAHNEQAANLNDIPGIPMEISVDTHNCEILPNGKIVRHSKDGKDLGKVTNKNDIKVIKEVAEKEQEVR